MKLFKIFYCCLFAALTTSQINAVTNSGPRDSYEVKYYMLKASKNVNYATKINFLVETFYYKLRVLFTNQLIGGLSILKSAVIAGGVSWILKKTYSNNINKTAKELIEKKDELKSKKNIPDLASFLEQHSAKWGTNFKDYVRLIGITTFVVEIYRLLSLRADSYFSEYRFFDRPATNVDMVGPHYKSAAVFIHWLFKHVAIIGVMRGVLALFDSIIPQCLAVYITANRSEFEQIDTDKDMQIFLRKAYKGIIPALFSQIPGAKYFKRTAKS